jgi:hypothetical protein
VNDLENVRPPQSVQDILSRTEHIGFQMTSEPLVGSMNQACSQSLRSTLDKINELRSSSKMLEPSWNTSALQSNNLT